MNTRTTIQNTWFLVAAVVAAAGACLLTVTGIESWGNEFDPDRLMMSAVLAGAAAACSRFPLRFGMRDVFVSLDSIPLVLAAVLVPTFDAGVVGVCATLSAIIGQPPLEEGWRRWFWRIQMPLGTSLVIMLASLFAHDVLRLAYYEPILLLPALLIALLVEAMFGFVVFAEVEATTPGHGRELLDSPVVPAANVFLPMAAVAMLTPYLSGTGVWEFMLLLPVLLVGMYGLLWVANSQQREKRRGDKLKDTFSRYVPEGIVDDNIETMQEIELGGEQADLSVLFCDIRGFTSWSEDKGATEVITELNVLLTELSASVMGTGGTLDKFTGDGLMAFWGAPVTMDDHADRASRAALDMLQRLEAVNARRQEHGQEPFAIGVAVHSGSAVVGNVGHERRLDYTAIGDTVNTTARLEASTKDLGAVLLVSRDTVELLSAELRARATRIGDVSMKGKSRPVEAWMLQPQHPEQSGVDDEFAA